MKRKVSWGLLVGLLFVTGCATTDAGGGSGGDPDVITKEELQEDSSFNSAYNAIAKLRPHWLRKRGRQSMSNPGSITVYVDGSRFGTVRALRQIQAVNVQEMSFLSPAEATTRYGTGHEHGVILVEMKEGL